MKRTELVMALAQFTKELGEKPEKTYEDLKMYVYACELVELLQNDILQRANMQVQAMAETIDGLKSLFDGD